MYLEEAASVWLRCSTNLCSLGLEVAQRRPAKPAEVLSVPPEAARKLHCLHGGGKTWQKPASRAGCKGTSRSLCSEPVKRASLHVSLSHKDKAATSQSPGTGTSLHQFPAAVLMWLLGSPPSQPHGVSQVLGMPVLRLHSWGRSLSGQKASCRESWKGALQREEEARMGGTGAGRNTQQHDRDWGSAVAGSGQAWPPLYWWDRQAGGRGQSSEASGARRRRGCIVSSEFGYLLVISSSQRW